MPRLDRTSAALFMSRLGAELLLGNSVFQVDTAARTDTLAAHGEFHLYTTGGDVVLQVFNKDAGAWRATTLT